MLDLIESPIFSVHSGGDSGSPAIDFIVGFLSIIDSLTHSSPAQAFATLLPGIAAIQNIHPLLVHFPIAFLTAFFLIDLLGSLLKKSEWRRTADWFLYLGCIFAGLTMIAGLLAADSVPHPEAVHQIMEDHESLGVTIFSLASALSIWRLFNKPAFRGVVNYLYLSLAGLLCLFLIFAADLGGLMVYKHGVAVAAAQALQPESLSAHHHHDSE